MVQGETSANILWLQLAASKEHFRLGMGVSGVLAYSPGQVIFRKPVHFTKLIHPQISIQKKSTQTRSYYLCPISDLHTKTLLFLQLSAGVLVDGR